MKTSRAKSLRQNPTPAEKRLWRLLYPSRTGGVHFRKQAAIGPYVADFACHHARLVIELDGDSHASQRGYDARRDRFLREQGFSVLRFSNAEVFESPEGVYQRIVEALRKTPSPTLPTEGEGVRDATSPRVGEDGRGVRSGLGPKP